MELHQVRYFLAVAETFNFTRAADLCNVTQPALTKAIQKLEHELGGPLIHRERHLTQLTDLGKTVLPMLENTFSAAQAARAEAERYQRKEIAILRIGLPPSISAGFAVQPMAEVERFISSISIEIVESKESNLIQLLLAGDINAAFVADTQNLPERIDTWTLLVESFVLLAAVESEVAKRQTITVKELRKTSFIERVGCDAISRLKEVCFAPHESPTIKHRSMQDAHLQHMASVGLGCVLAPEHTPRLASLAAVRIEGDPLKRHISLLAVAGRRYSPALDAFIKVARLFDWSKLSQEPRSDLQSKPISSFRTIVAANFCLLCSFVSCFEPVVAPTALAII